MDLKLIALFLAAAVFAAPLAKRLGIGSVLGYLMAGVLIGPSVLGVVLYSYQVESVLHIAEFGVVMLLFIIGLELKPIRLWALRSAVFGFGGIQVLATTVVVFGAAVALGQPVNIALFIGFALALSSTAFAIQVLTETGELTSRHGRLGFSALLFQDLAAIPLIAAVPLFALSGAVEGAMDLTALAKAVGGIVTVIVVGKLMMHRVIPLIAATGLAEAMTASALLTIVAVALAMEAVGLSAALGAFLAGALLADSEYRHELQANVAPFQGLLLGLFFTAIGMNLNLKLIWTEPLVILWLTVSLVVVKAVIVYGLARWQGLKAGPARRVAIVISQGGEFAFVLFASAFSLGVIESRLAELLAVVVTLSMVATPLLLKLDDLVVKLQEPDREEAEYDMIPDEAGHVVIAGLGRVGQIIARLLMAKRIPIIALDADPQQVALVRQFGGQSYYGDATRIDILRAARTDAAMAFVLTVSDVDASLNIAEIVRRNFPDVPIIARARNRQHVHRLMDLGVTVTHRETFLSSLELARETLRHAGISETEARRSVDAFRNHDRQRLYDDYKISSDSQKVQNRFLKAQQELEQIMAQDAEALEPEDAAE